MARKNDLSSKLQNASESRPGWRDTITGARQPQTQTPRSRPSPQPQQEERDSPLKRKTYLLTPELIEQIAALAEAERVGINELVRFLLRSALDQVATDEMEIPTRPARRRIVE